MKRYRYYCKTEERFIKLWATQAPIECYIDPSHEINMNSITHEKVNMICSTTPLKTTASSENYEIVATVVYPGSDFAQTILRVYVVASLRDDATTGSLRLYDATNGFVMTEAPVESSVLHIVDLGEPNNVPTDPAVLELHAKTSKTLSVTNMTLVH